MTKICSKCKARKYGIDFFNDSRHKDGKQSQCKKCQKAEFFPALAGKPQGSQRR